MRRTARVDVVRPNIARTARGASRRSPLRAIARITGLAVAIAVVAFAGYAGERAATDPRLALASVTVEGADHTSPADVIAAAALPAGNNVWLLDTRAAAARVRALPWIETAGVRRAWPNRVTIVVRERTAVAALALTRVGSSEDPAPEFALIDDQLHVLALGPLPPNAASLPQLRVEPAPAALQPGSTAGEDVGAALDALTSLRALGFDATALSVTPSTGIEAVTRSGLHVIFGASGDLGRKVSLLAAIEPRIASKDRVVAVDLRSTRAPTVLYR
ncbi:MAG TPA: FtsQ-type POTRA domain-containing protein [Candidatus Eremiobacteraceae bacterium]|nr:FtsQ-type POTRA domain-containing protein [Candidatus Eremiobacteraceae bacterium]